MLARLARYYSALRKMSLRKRILCFNTFLLSMLTYTNMVYPIPYGPGLAVDRIRKACTRHIVQYRGTAYRYVHLIQPKTRFGPSRAEACLVSGDKYVQD